MIIGKMYFPQEIWKDEIMSYFPKPIKKIPHINDLKLLFKEADIILFNYTRQMYLDHADLSDFGYESEEEYYNSYFHWPAAGLLRCNFYDKWIMRCSGIIDINYWTLELLHDDPD